MSFPDQARRRLSELLDQVLEQGSSPAQNRELDVLVQEHPELAREVASQLRIHGWLEWESIEVKVFDPPIAAPEANLVGGRTPAAAPRPAVAWPRRLAAAAVLMAACGAGLWLATSGGRLDDTVAEIVDDRLVAWSETTDALTTDGRIRPGRVAIDSGMLTLRFRSGATLKALGPASLRIDSDMLVQLDRGQATAHVPHWCAGFTIETPDVEIVDLGTEFGVVARGDGKTDVVVFDGEVDLTPTGQDSKADHVQKRLKQGEAVSVSQRGGIDRIVQVRRDTGGESWSTSRSPTESECVIADIYDNLRATGSSSYYQVTPGGLAEDALAFVDRPHQWNGIGSGGLPDFLRRIDYVRTFNDDKYLGQLEIVVKLARPAWLYILFDDRVPRPEWLEAGFEDTGIDVGLDEGPWITADMSLSTAIGGGNSVDRVFSIWRKRCEKTLSVTLGSLGPSVEARAMYGIAAAPL